jgi:protein SCO1
MLLVVTNGALAQVPPPPKPIVPPPRILKDIGIEQKLDAQVPAELVFKNEEGKDVRLGDFYGKRPIVLTLVYYQCPMLCTMVLNDLVRAMRGIGTLNLGQDYDVVTVSFDPSETSKLAAAKKKQYISEYGRLSAANGWHFLTGQQAEITKLAQTVGFHYAWDDHTKTWAHASGIIVLTPTGKVSRYFYGIDYAPSDLKLSLLDAGKETINPKAADRILLYCFHYDPRSGKYGLLVSRLIQAGGVVTFLLLGGFIGLNLVRERRVHHGDTEARRHAWESKEA